MLVSCHGGGGGGQNAGVGPHLRWAGTIRVGLSPPTAAYSHSLPPYHSPPPLPPHPSPPPAPPPWAIPTLPHIATLPLPPPCRCHHPRSALNPPLPAGATTLDEYRKYIEKDPALERRFQQVWKSVGVACYSRPG